jgi:hypothetical protein
VPYTACDFSELMYWNIYFVNCGSIISIILFTVASTFLLAACLLCNHKLAGDSFTT